MPSIISRLRAAAIGFRAPHVVAQGGTGRRADALERGLAEVRREVALMHERSADDVRSVAASAFEASWRAALRPARTAPKVEASYQAGCEAAAGAIAAAKLDFLAELDRVRDVVSPRPVIGDRP